MEAPVQNSNVSYRFDKSERLRLRSLVEALFSGGKRQYSGPLRGVWRVWRAEDTRIPVETISAVARVQVMTVVPKRHVRKAVGRVLIRRRMRECYRLGRNAMGELPDVLEREGVYLSLALIYNSRELASYSDIERAVAEILEKVSAKVQKLFGDAN